VNVANGGCNRSRRNNTMAKPQSGVERNDDTFEGE
jgi:hypothetical protein